MEAVSARVIPAFTGLKREVTASSSVRSQAASGKRASLSVRAVAEPVTKVTIEEAEARVVKGDIPPCPPPKPRAAHPPGTPLVEPLVRLTPACARSPLPYEEEKVMTISFCLTTEPDLQASPQPEIASLESGVPGDSGVRRQLHSPSLHPRR